MRTLRLAVIAVIALGALAGPSAGKAALRYENFVILIDQSNEMNMRYNDKSKHMIARKVAWRMLNNIPQNEGIKGSIYMYGTMAAESKHQYERVQKHMVFDLAAFQRSLDKVDKQTGPSTMSVALRAARRDLASESGRTAVFIISGGNMTDTGEPLREATELKKSKGPDLCIYTILVGKSKKGGKDLSHITKKGKCGFPVNADSLHSGAEVKRYIQAIFYGPGGDADSDGVDDDKDQCPGTPFGASVDYRGCWVVHNINFDVAKWDIKPQYYNQLNEIAGVMNANPDLYITIEGHTDSDGSDDSNMTLSQRRAQSVMNYLISADVDGARLKSVGKGESQPVADNSTSNGKAMNRRIEFVIERR